jgi:hypothetical protein
MRSCCILAFAGLQDYAVAISKNILRQAGHQRLNKSGLKDDLCTHGVRLPFHVPHLPTAFKVQGIAFKFQAFQTFIQAFSSQDLHEVLKKLESFSRIF